MKLYVFLLAAVVCTSAHAQQNLSPTVMAAGGGVSKYNDIELEWTLGEFFTGTSSAYKNMYTAGFQQPLLNKQPLQISDVKLGTVSIFPNPVKDFINIHFKLTNEEPINMVLTDVYGKTLLQKSIVTKSNTSKLPVQQLIAGNYYLSLYDAKGNITNMFKIIKIN